MEDQKVNNTDEEKRAGRPSKAKERESEAKG